MIRRFSSIVFQRETLRPVLALAAVSAIAMGLVATRMLVTHSVRHGYLAWNLFLAWLPLFFCLAAVQALRTHGERHWKFWALAVTWLLFLPNAPYIFTDLTHLGPRGRPTFWVDLVMIVMTAWTASLLGFVSLYVMQTLVARRYGWVIGWVFAIVVSGLVGLGVYIGRFLRWNTWDVLVNPLGIASDMFLWAVGSFGDKKLVVYPMMFALLFFAAHVTLAALLHLRLQSLHEGDSEPQRA
jgi:uncharacterized membrane protein